MLDRSIPCPRRWEYDRNQDAKVYYSIPCPIRRCTAPSSKREAHRTPTERAGAAPVPQLDPGLRTCRWRGGWRGRACPARARRSTASGGSGPSAHRTCIEHHRSTHTSNRRTSIHVNRNGVNRESVTSARRSTAFGGSGPSAHHTYTEYRRSTHHQQTHARQHTHTHSQAHARSIPVNRNGVNRDGTFSARRSIASGGSGPSAHRTCTESLRSTSQTQSQYTPVHRNGVNISARRSTASGGSGPSAHHTYT